ncbi:MAG: hypothetical protein ACLGHX_03200, partial [Acidimicrobiia bacterium]
VINTSRTVLGTDADPLVNTASASCSPAGFSNILTASDGHSVNLFQPSITLDKTGDDYSKLYVPDQDVPGTVVGDPVDYTITLTNTSSSDTPQLTCTVTDTLLGVNETVSLDWDDAPHVINATRTVQVGDADPLVNTANVSCSPAGFSNILTASDTHSVDILHPEYTVTKQCLTQTVPVGGSAIFDVTFTNTGDVALIVTADEDMEWISGGSGISGTVTAGTAFNLAVGDVVVFEISILALEGPIVENTINASATLPAWTGLDNIINRYSTDSCDVVGGATRTPGFWQTHHDYTTHVFEVHLGGTIDLGWKTLDDPSEVFGMFWANNARESDGDRRSRTCQAQVLGSFHLLAAILNTGLDNGAAVPLVDGVSAIDLMRQALADGDVKDIRSLIGVLDAYNNSGTDIAIIDNDGTLAGKADPNLAKDIADFTIADC